MNVGFGFLGGSVGIESAYNARDPDSIPGSGRSPGKGNGNPLQYSCLGNPTDRGAWRATDHSPWDERVGCNLDSITNTMDMNLSKLWEIVKNREAWRVAVHGVKKSQTQLSDCSTTIL